MKPRYAAVLVVLASLAIPSQALHAQKKSRDKITRQEIMALPQKDMDVFQVVRNLRPHFLEAPRGVRSMGNSVTFPTVVYVDGKKESGLDALRLMNPMDVDEIRYLDPPQAMNEFGQMANGGAVVIKRYKAPKVQIAPTPSDTVKPPSAR